MAAVLTPVWDFLGWVRGCACHEDALMRGQNTPCPRQGCRGPELAAKVDMVCEQVTWACGAWSDGGSLARERMVDLGPTVVALLRAKFAWVNDLPCFIWQVCRGAHLACAPRIAHGPN